MQQLKKKRQGPRRGSAPRPAASLVVRLRPPRAATRRKRQQDLQEELARLRRENERLRAFVGQVGAPGVVMQALPALGPRPHPPAQAPRLAPPSPGAAPPVPWPGQPNTAPGLMPTPAMGARAPRERYRILRRLAAGGMAEVFLADSESLAGFSKRVAIKRILPGLTKDPRFREMFLDEARLSLRLQHSRIVQVFDIGRAGDAYFIVMEYVDGVDVKTLLSWRLRLGRPIPVRFALHIALEACSALAYAHELRHPETNLPLGIVHRDVTPTNILVSKQGEVKVLDFGVAKAANQAVVTDPGLIKGKLGYLAPETANGQAFDHRVDVFAVGIVLWELLAGLKLYHAKTDYDVLRLAQKAQIPDLTGVIPEVDAELMALVSTALARRPEERFQTAGDLAEALARYSYAHDQKVTSQDLGNLVRRCLRDRENWTQPKQVSSAVEGELLEEVERFHSILYDPSDQGLAQAGAGAGGAAPAPKPSGPVAASTLLLEPLSALLPATPGSPGQAPGASGPRREPTPELSLADLVGSGEQGLAHTGNTGAHSLLDDSGAPRLAADPDEGAAAAAGPPPGGTPELSLADLEAAGGLEGDEGPEDEPGLGPPPVIYFEYSESSGEHSLAGLVPAPLPAPGSLELPASRTATLPAPRAPHVPGEQTQLVLLAAGVAPPRPWARWVRAGIGFVLVAGALVAGALVVSGRWPW